MADDAARLRERRAALEAELATLNEQRAAVERALADLRAALPPGKGLGPAKGKKRPSLPDGPAGKRARVEHDRERRVNLIWQQCATVGRTLLRHRDSAPFHRPVDPVALKCPDYLNIIKTPMDLGTALARLEGRGGRRAYARPHDFRDDVRLMFSNCRTYNKAGTPVRRMGDALCELWERKWAGSGVEAKWAAEAERQKDEDLDLAGAPPAVLKARALDRDLRRLTDAARAAGEPPPPRPARGDERDMTFDEKRRLSAALGALPADKLAAALDIVAAGVPGLGLGGEAEVEVDVDALPRETLWALDAFAAAALPALHVVKERPPTAGATGGGGAPAKAAPAPAPGPAPSPAASGGGSASGSQGEVGSKAADASSAWDGREEREEGRPRAPRPPPLTTAAHLLPPQNPPTAAPTATACQPSSPPRARAARRASSSTPRRRRR